MENSHTSKAIREIKLIKPISIFNDGEKPKKLINKIHINIQKLKKIFENEQIKKKNS